MATSIPPIPEHVADAFKKIDQTKGIDACGIFLAVRAAFMSDYDYYKYSGQIRLAAETFACHKNKWQFIKLGKYYSVENMPYFLATTFFHHDAKDMWIDKIVKNMDQYQDEWLLWKNWQEQRVPNLIEVVRDISKKYDIRTKETFIRFLKPPPSRSIPQLYAHYLALKSIDDKIMFMSAMIILDDMYELFPVWDLTLKGEYIWDDLYANIKKFRPFFFNYKPISHINLVKAIDELFTFPSKYI